MSVVQILQNIDNCNKQFFDGRLLYDQHTHDLETQISNLELQLSRINCIIKYEQDMHEYIIIYDVPRGTTRGIGK